MPGSLKHYTGIEVHEINTNYLQKREYIDDRLHCLVQLYHVNVEITTKYQSGDNSKSREVTVTVVILVYDKHVSPGLNTYKASWNCFKGFGVRVHTRFCLRL